MTRKIRKAIIPVAGLGTRFLPITKSVPQEMLPIINRPIIDFVIREAFESGIEKICLVSNKKKDSILNHFRTNNILNNHLEDISKSYLARTISDVEFSEKVLTSVRQIKPLGLGHAIWCARHFVGGESFAVLLPDDLFLTSRSCIGELMAIYKEFGDNIIALKKISQSKVSNYGIVEYDYHHNNLYNITKIIEKPLSGETSSSMAVVGRYILNPIVMDFLNRRKIGRGREIQLTDALSYVLTKERCRGYEFSERHYDCGSKSGYLSAQVYAGLMDPQIKLELLKHVKEFT